MTDADLWAAWRLWLGIGSAIVVIVATLLIVIRLTARKIFADAVRALAAGEAIREKTMSIWALQASNETAADLLDTVQSIENKATKLAEALESHAGTAGAGRTGGGA